MKLSERNLLRFDCSSSSTKSNYSKEIVHLGHRRARCRETLWPASDSMNEHRHHLPAKKAKPKKRDHRDVVLSSNTSIFRQKSPVLVSDDDVV